jgi:catechol 2,3-dioxygenase-like lactoylglutathione lyase family enzyme
VPAIECLHMNHLNVVVQDFEASVERLAELFGARFVVDIPQPEWHAGLVTFGGIIFELFAPHEFLLNARYGPHYLGIEYQVADVEEVRQAVQAKGIRIARDLGIAFHTHPLDTFGVGLEFLGHSFHAQENPSWIEQLKPMEYWRDEHPLGCVGLRRYSVAVSDIDAATAFFRDFVGGTVTYEAHRQAAGARAVGLAVADSVIELIAPIGDGPLRRHLNRYGDGIRSAVLAVRDLDTARRYFAERGVALHPGDAVDALAIAADDARGVLFEISE